MIKILSKLLQSSIIQFQLYKFCFFDLNYTISVIFEIILVVTELAKSVTQPWGTFYTYFDIVKSFFGYCWKNNAQWKCNDKLRR